MRGRKAALEHLCDKANPEKLGLWKVKKDQNIFLEKPSDKNSWESTMSQRVIVECINCGAVKYCSLEKLNEKHFEGTEYNIPAEFWTKPVGFYNVSGAITPQRKEKIEEVAKVLAAKSKAAKLKNKIVVSSSKE